MCGSELTSFGGKGISFTVLEYLTTLNYNLSRVFAVDTLYERVDASMRELHRIFRPPTLS